MNTRNKALIATGIIVFVLGVIVFLVGGYLAGWDFAAYFQSSAFVWVAVLVGMYVLAVAVVLVKDWLDKKL